MTTHHWPTVQTEECYPASLDIFLLFFYKWNYSSTHLQVWEDLKKSDTWEAFPMWLAHGKPFYDSQLASVAQRDKCQLKRTVTRCGCSQATRKLDAGNPVHHSSAGVIPISIRSSKMASEGMKDPERNGNILAQEVFMK